MRAFKNKHFARFMKDTGITDANLLEAVRQAEVGLIDADLGAGLIKQRIARPNQGKSGGFRTILVFRAADRSVFIYGFAKNDRANIRQDELKALKALASELLGYPVTQLDQAVRQGALVEVKDNE
jgi:hypothetical protein